MIGKILLVKCYCDRLVCSLVKQQAHALGRPCELVGRATPQEQLLHNSYSLTHCQVACGATGGNGNSCVIISSLWKFEFASTGGNGQDL